jgi:hypothetical protein
MMAEELNLNRETARKILTDDLGTRRISAKMVPKILGDEQKQLEFLAKKNQSQNWTFLLNYHTRPLVTFGCSQS